MGDYAERHRTVRKAVWMEQQFQEMNERGAGMASRNAHIAMEMLGREFDILWERNLL